MQVATVSSRSWLVQRISVAVSASVGKLWKVFWMVFELSRCCLKVQAWITCFLRMSLAKCLLLAYRCDPCGMGFGVFCDASLLRLSGGQFFGSFARWSSAKSAVWALGGGCPGASADSFWYFWAAIFASIAFEVSVEGCRCSFFGNLIIHADKDKYDCCNK